jgi:hypothetical protein
MTVCDEFHLHVVKTENDMAFNCCMLQPPSVHSNIVCNGMIYKHNFILIINNLVENQNNSISSLNQICFQGQK